MTMSHENTTFYEGRHPLASRDWSFFILVLQCLNGVLLCCLIFMTVCVIVHGTRERSWSFSTRKGKLYIAGTVTVFCAYPRLTLDQLYFHIPQIPGALGKCELLVDMTNASGAIAVFSAYAFLWVRQRMTYSYSSMKKLTPPWIYKLSWVTLAIIIIGSTTLNAIYIIPTSFEAHGNFCVGIPISRRAKGFRTLEVMKKYAMAAVLLLLQTLLLTLFIYPMARTRKKVTALSDQNGAAILKTIRRSLISTVGAVSTDIIALIIIAFTPVGAPILVTNVVYNTTLVINLCCVICTFKDPLNIFLVCCKKANPSDDAPHGPAALARA